MAGKECWVSVKNNNLLVRIDTYIYSAMQKFSKRLEQLHNLSLYKK